MTADMGMEWIIYSMLMEYSFLMREMVCWCLTCILGWVWTHEWIIISRN